MPVGNTIIGSMSFEIYLLVIDAGSADIHTTRTAAGVGARVASANSHSHLLLIHRDQ